jgi:hypothetical protein
VALESAETDSPLARLHHVLLIETRQSPVQVTLIQGSVEEFPRKRD